MSDFLMEVYYFAVDTLRELAAAFLGWTLVLVVLVLPLLVVVYFFMKKAAASRGVNLNVRWNLDAPQRAPRSAATRNLVAGLFRATPTPSPVVDSLEQTRAGLLKVYKGLLLGVGTVLLAAAFYTALVATTANGLALVAFLLLCLAGAAFGGMWKYERRASSGPTNVVNLVQAIEPHVSMLITEPQVGVLGNQAIERAKELSQEGAPLDAICREVNPEYGQWGSFQQQAFQRVMEAVLQHYSAAAQAADPAPGGSGKGASRR